MTIINLSSNRSGDSSNTHWQPSMTQEDAARRDLPKKLYLELVAFARVVVNDHIRLRTPRGEWEPQPTHADHFTARYIENGETQLVSSLEAEVDPALDDAHGLLEAVREQLDDLDSDTLPMSAIEVGTSHSAAEASGLVDANDAQIADDASRGVHVHRRVSNGLRWFGGKAPWIEGIGMLAFVTLFLNVRLWRPQDDILGWTFALAVVLVTIAGQIFLVHPAAEAHNHMREHEAAGNRHEAAASRSRRNRFLYGATIVTSVITGAMIYRGLAALGDAELHITIIMIALAALAGLLMPVIAYFAIALDGSSVSRERDSLVAALDEDLDDDLATRSQAKRDLDAVGETRDHLNGHTFPSICAAVQETIDEVYFPYNAARMLIGGLAGDPPAKSSMSLQADGTGRIGTGIRGARSVDLAPLLDRCRRLASLEAERRQLANRLESTPAHPWAKRRR